MTFDGGIVDGCPLDAESGSLTVDDLDAGEGGGTVDDPLNGITSGELPFKDQLVRVEEVALVRPNPNGAGNDVVYLLEELGDGTYRVTTVFYCGPEATEAFTGTDTSSDG